MMKKSISLVLAIALTFMSSMLYAKTSAPSSKQDLLNKLKPFAVTNLDIDKLSPAMIHYHDYLQQMTTKLETCIAASKCGNGSVESSTDLDAAVDNLIDSIKEFNKTVTDKNEKKRNMSDKTLTKNATTLEEQFKQAIPDAGDALPTPSALLQPAKATGSKTIDEVLSHNKKAVLSQIKAALKAIEDDKSPEANARRMLLKNMQADVETLDKTIQAGNEGRASALLQQMEKTISVINERPLGADMKDINSVVAGYKDYAGKLTSSKGDSSVDMIKELSALIKATGTLTGESSPVETSTRLRPHVQNRTGTTIAIPGLDPRRFRNGEDPQRPGLANHSIHEDQGFHEEPEPEAEPPRFSAPHAINMGRF